MYKLKVYKKKKKNRYKTVMLVGEKRILERHHIKMIGQLWLSQGEMGEIVFDDECEAFYLGKYTSLTSFMEAQTENCLKSKGRVMSSV